jgi:hypothetical protein
VLPLGVGHLLDRVVGHLEGGIVDQDVDAAELTHGRLDDRPVAVLAVVRPEPHVCGAAGRLLLVLGRLRRLAWP